MKRYIEAATFSEYGSGKDANKRSGRLAFGRGLEIIMDNGGTFNPTSAKTTFDKNTGEVETCVNVFIQYDTDDDLEFAEFFNYTPEECKQLYEVVTSMSSDELLEFLKQQHDINIGPQ